LVKAIGLDCLDVDVDHELKMMNYPIVDLVALEMMYWLDFAHENH
jgi:hypothetical protein